MRKWTYGTLGISVVAIAIAGIVLAGCGGGTGVPASEAGHDAEGSGHEHGMGESHGEGSGHEHGMEGMEGMERPHYTVEDGPFACPMHPDQVTDDPEGNCPVCGMNVAPVSSLEEASDAAVPADEAP